MDNHTQRTIANAPNPLCTQCFHPTARPNFPPMLANFPHGTLLPFYRVHTDQHGPSARPSPYTVGGFLPRFVGLLPLTSFCCLCDACCRCDCAWAAAGLELSALGFLASRAETMRACNCSSLLPSSSLLLHATSSALSVSTSRAPMIMSWLLGSS